MSNYFSNSLRQLVSFYSHDKQLSLKELEEIKVMIEAEIKKKSFNH